VSDFQSEYGIRLGREHLSWREFLTLLQGLMACDSRLARKFMSGVQPSAATDPDPEV
jgi:hypothetical protein